MKKIDITIICSNIMLKSSILFVLYEEYQRVGHFQWVDQNAIEDKEELYLTPILMAIFALSSMSTIYEYIKNRIKHNFWKAISLLLWVLSIAYGAILLILSWTMLILILANMHSQETFELSLILVLLGTGMLGLLVFYHNSNLIGKHLDSSPHESISKS